MLESHKGIYEYVVYDSVGVEKTFAQRLEANPLVKGLCQTSLLVQKIDTPLGTYNPDWAVVIDDEGQAACTLYWRPRAISSN